ncbi:hypothetical protein [Nocardia wallacei]|uniref:hypothetical protein n=1 Tax=Nocardia wallacei TaxID=480035 RepID=UPI002458E570|nr:hypothetical protein [Nocardia wallacei]
MQVDPDALRTWSKWLDGLSGEIESLADGVTMGADGSFPGTTVEGALTEVCDAIKGGLVSFASRPAEMSEIARGAGDKYEIQDQDFAGRLQAMRGLQ